MRNLLLLQLNTVSQFHINIIFVPNIDLSEKVYACHMVLLQS